MFSDAVLGWLTDARDNALQIASYLDDVDEAAFANNAEKRDAVERCLERVSEAVSRVHRSGVDLEQAESEVPWRDVRAIGNHLRHAYDRIDAGIIWQTAVRDIAPIVAAIERLLARE